MASDSDDIVSLPGPPPPRPAARRAAIEAALRKFDGIEQPSAPRSRGRPWRIQWATLNRRPAGALVAAAIIAVIGIPAVQVALRDRPPEISTKASEPAVDQPVRDMADKVGPAPPSPAAGAETAAPAARPSPIQPITPRTRAEEVRSERAAKSNQMFSPPPQATPGPAPLIAAPPAPPAPPPPPPPAEPERGTADEGNIVVTGSRVRRSNLESPSAVAITDPYGEFLSQLQAGLAANDRRAVIRLIGFPLRVDFDGTIRTYGSSSGVERDFERIFTPAVRQAALAMRPDALIASNGGRLRGNARIRFGCGSQSCPPGRAIRIREIAP